MELSDNFNGPDLGLQWTFWKEYAPKNIHLKNQTLQLTAKGTTPADGRILLTAATEQT